MVPPPLQMKYTDEILYKTKIALTTEGTLICVCNMNLFSSCVYEPPHDKTNKMACVPSEDSDQPGHSPSLIRDFAVHSMGS